MFTADLEYHKDNIFELTYFHNRKDFWQLHSDPLEYQILLVFDGDLLVRYKRNTVVLHPDDFLVIPPHKEHSEWSDDAVSVLSLGVKKKAVEQDGAMVLNLIDDIAEKLQQRGMLEAKHIVTLSKAASQILYVFRNQEDECSEFVAEAREILEKWPERDISLDKMAELVRTCRGHLVRTFKKEVGLTPHQYQIQNRVRMATRLLIDTDITINTVRQECGFYDISHFKRHFFRLLGMSPYEFRKMFKTAGHLLR